MGIKISNGNLNIDHDVTSSILQTCGFKGLFTYISILMYKKVEEIHYTDFETMKEYSLVTKDQDFLYQLKKLENLGLLIKKGKKFTVTTKLKNWLEVAEVKTPKSLTLGGTFCIDLATLYRLKKTFPHELKNRMFLTLSNAIRKGKSISRGFIATATGVEPKEQIKIENKYSDYIKSEKFYTPVNKEEQYNIKHIPSMNGRIDFTDKKITNAFKEKTHCKVIQLGSKLAFDNLICGGFLKWKEPRKKRTPLALNKSELKQDDICDWESYRVHIDLEDGKSKWNCDLFNINDKRYKTWDMFDKYNMSNVTIINIKGDFLPFREHFRRFYK